MQSPFTDNIFDGRKNFREHLMAVKWIVYDALHEAKNWTDAHSKINLKVYALIDKLCTISTYYKVDDACITTAQPTESLILKIVK